MAYNPKRPRPVLRDDDAPVEALIADEDVIEDPVAVEAERQVIDLADRVASDETGDETGDESADGAADSAASASSPAPSSLPREASSVPVAPAPTEETANRAVAVATGAAAIITLIVLLLLRRRNRQG